MKILTTTRSLWVPLPYDFDKIDREIELTNVAIKEADSVIEKLLNVRSETNG